MSNGLPPHEPPSGLLVMSDAQDFLKLAALDAEDLQIISAQLQDAVLTIENIRYLPRQQKLALVANRFDWEDAETKDRPPYRRRLTGVQFARVKSVRSRNIRRDSKDAVLVLLSVVFTAGEPPAGEIVLSFAGGGDMRLDVECIEVMLQDLGLEWQTGAKPVHDLSQAS
jgi:hypothetical protein